MKKVLPLLILLVGVAYLASSLRAPKQETDFDLNAFGRLPVLLNGRIKPLDTVARTTLLTFQNRQRVSSPENGTLVSSPIAWLADVAFRPDKADTYPTFKIENLELLSLLGKNAEDLKINYDSGAKKVMAAIGFLPRQHSRFSYNDLESKLPELDRQSQLATSTDSKQRTPFQRAVLHLVSNLGTYQRLKFSFVPPDVPDFLAELRSFEENLPKSIQAAEDNQAGKPHDAEALRAGLNSVNRYQNLAGFTYVHPIPSIDPADPADWRSIGQALMDSFASRRMSYEVMTYAALAKAYRSDNATAFNEGVRLYRETVIGNRYAEALKKTDVEARFNAAEPFYKSINLYGLAFFAAVFSWLCWPVALGRSAFYLVAFAFVATTIGLVTRVWIGGYAPVTNLYSSALWVGWAVSGLCLILEAIYRNGIGSVAAGMIGVGTLIIAHHLSFTNDTLEMMRAVLDSNFWLTTHVLTVTTGYSATFLAGALAIIYIVRGVLTRSLDKTTADTLSRMVYGVVCFAMLLSFVGTITGGIWADQSWGRFWGWDPKENGALLIVIWNAIFLHARWGGLCRQRGLMMIAVFGNIVTGWSWFGTNLLEVGLHSYGFTENGKFTLWTFVSTQLAIIALALIPLEKWRSFSAKSA